MNVNKLVNLSYDVLEHQLKNTVHKFHDPKGFSQIHVCPKKSSLLEDTIYTFEKDTLITKDIMYKTKDGGTRNIFTNFFENGTTTTIKEINERLQKYVKTTYDKTIVPLSYILNKRKNNTLLNIVDKAQGVKIDKNLPVTIIKKEIKTKGLPTQIERNVLIKGKKQTLRIHSTDNQVFVYTKNGNNAKTYDFGRYGDLKKSRTLNSIINWFIKENNELI